MLPVIDILKGYRETFWNIERLQMIWSNDLPDNATGMARNASDAGEKNHILKHGDWPRR